MVIRQYNKLLCEQRFAYKYGQTDELEDETICLVGLDNCLFYMVKLSVCIYTGSVLDT